MAQHLESEASRSAEAALERNHPAYQLDTLQRLGRIGLWEVRLPERTTTWSDELYRILGLDPAQPNASPETYLAIVHPDDRKLVEANITSVMQGNPVHRELEHRIIWPDGEIRHVIGRTQVSILGSTMLLYGTVQDITQAKTMEAELRKNEERFKYAAHAISDTIWDWDIINKRFWCSENTQTLFGQICPEQADSVEWWISKVHPEDKDRVRRETDTALNGSANSLCIEYRFLQRDDICIDVLTRAIIVRDRKGKAVRMVGATVDITERKQAEAARKAHEEKIRHLAFHDSLTGLANRVLLSERVRQMLDRHDRQHSGAILLLDLDDFKALNDTFGHDTGDRLLKLVAERLTYCTDKSDTVARLGGDEFVILQEHLPDEDTAEATDRARTLAEKILAAIRLPFVLEDHRNYFVTPSIGICLFSRAQESAEDILKRADLAMYQAKAAGRNTLRFFDPDMEAAVASRVALEGDMREALMNSQFALHYQPQFTCDGELVGAEALLRWTHPAQGPVSPAKFIPLAEKTGLIMPLGLWVLTTACTLLKRWSAIPACAGLSIAVNVSAVQLRSAGFVEQVLAALEQTGADPRRLKIELTESILVDNVEESIDKMMVLKSLGVCFALDDFGTGYSSLSYLKRLPLDHLKIDQSFVRDIETDQNDAVIARTIIALGHSLGLSVIAEGVETEGQRKFLDQYGCPAYQGYLFSPPLCSERLEAFVKARHAGADSACHMPGPARG